MILRKHHKKHKVTHTRSSSLVGVGGGSQQKGSPFHHHHKYKRRGSLLKRANSRHSAGEIRGRSPLVCNTIRNADVSSGSSQSTSPNSTLSERSSTPLATSSGLLSVETSSSTIKQSSPQNEQGFNSPSNSGGSPSTTRPLSLQCKTQSKLVRGIRGGSRRKSVGQIPLSPLARVNVNEFALLGEETNFDEEKDEKPMMQQEMSKMSLKKSKMKVHRILCKKKTSTKHDGK